ncbi:MAG TPA: hypothetical protein VMS12_10200 [Thermoanaerobaculia bacterium]|nr:hypothetical protein [Thermoanaerobaculia bacterium]
MANVRREISRIPAAVVTLALLAMSGCTSEEGPRVDDPLTTDTAAMTTAQTTATPEVVSGATVAVAIKDNRIAVSPNLPPGPVLFTIANSGTQLHSFTIEGEGIARGLDRNLAAGESGTLDVVLREGTYLAYCPILKHRDEGEAVEIEVAP